MYQSNRFNIPPPPRAFPGHLTSFPAREGGNLINLVFPGAGIWSLLIGGGEFDRYSRFHVTSRADSSRRQAFMHLKRKIPRGGLAEKQRLAQAFFCIWRYSRTIYIIFGMLECCLKPCLHTQLPEHNKFKATEKFPGGGSIWSPGMDLWWGIWTAFRPREGGIWTKILQKIQMPGGCPGEMLKLRFDWYIIIW